VAVAAAAAPQPGRQWQYAIESRGTVHFMQIDKRLLFVQ
jgi:hypothetical protein